MKRKRSGGEHRGCRLNELECLRIGVLSYSSPKIPSKDREYGCRPVKVQEPMTHGRMENLSAVLRPLFSQLSYELLQGEAPTQC